MRKKWFKRLIGAGLILTMLVGLTACNRTEGTSGNGIGGMGNGGNGGAGSNSSLAKEYVFREQALELPELEGDMNIREMKCIDDKIYILMDLYNWEAASIAEQEQMKLVSMNLDGSNVQIKDFQKSMGGDADSEEQESEDQEGMTGENQASESQEETSGEDGTEAAVEEKIAEDAIAADNVATVLPMLPEDYNNYSYEYTSIGRPVFSSDGKIYATKNYFFEDYTDPNNPIYEENNYVCCWDMNGVMQWEISVDELQSEETYSYIQTLIPMADGTVTLLLTGDQLEKATIDKEQKLSEKQLLSNSNEKLANNISTVLPKEDGTLAVIYMEQQGDYYGSKIATYDVVTDTLGEGYDVPDVFEMAGYWGISSGGGYDVVFTDSNGVYAFNAGDEQVTQIMSFINSDLNTTSMSNVQMIDADHLIAFYYDGVDYTMQGGLFTKVAPEDISDKQVMVLAGNYVEQDIKNRVIAFNKSNEQYRIVVKEYNKYNTMDDPMYAYTQLNNDIITGGMPDILITDLNMNMENYISKGLIADIGSLIDQDEELSQTEFMENVFNAYKVNDKLYYVIPSFYVRTLVAKEALVGDRTAWTMNDLKSVMANMPEGSQALGDVNKSGFFFNVMQYCGSDFVDVSTGKCNFNSQDFIEILEFVNTLPDAEEGYDEEYWSNYYMNYATQYREDRTLLHECYISQARDMNREINGYFGEDISYIGFPTLSGKGSVVIANQRIVLSAKSQVLEGAWEFVRYYLTNEYQSEIAYGLPVSKSAFMKNAQEATQNPYWIDENGEKQEYEDTFYINDENIVMPNMTQEQVDEFVAFVEGIDKCSYYNQDVQKIIEEEAAAYFSGQKSAQDVAGIIQSRVQIFVNENR